MQGCRLAIVASVLLAGTGGAELWAQTTQQPQQTPSPVPGTFRSRVTLVPLDVRVLDREGRPVADLKQDDFVVFEESVPQRIGHFSHQTLAAITASAGTELQMRRAPGGDLKPQNHRVFLLVLGRGRLQYPARGIDAAIDFVRERLLPQDQVAILAYNRATDFTTNHADIIRVLERFRDRHEAIEAELTHRISGLAAVYGSREIPANMQSRIDDLFGGAETPAFRQLPPGRLDLESIGEEAPFAYDINDPWRQTSFERFVTYNVQTFQDLGNVYGGIEYLRYIEGEKHLVFLTENGVFLPRVENDVRIADIASDARVVIDTIKTGGVFGEQPGRRWLSNEAWAHTWAGAALQNVSRLSGGQTSLFSYASKAFGRIDETTRSYYVLGYYPSNPQWDGRFRRIRVKVNRPGVTVLVRHGYFAREQLVPLDRRQFLTYSRIVSAGGYAGELSDIAVTLEPAVVRNAGGGREVAVEARVDPSRIAFTESNGYHVGTLDVSIFCGNRRQDTVCEQWDKVDLKLTPEALERARKEGIAYSARIPLKGDARYVKVVVYDYRADVLGSASRRVK